MKLYKAVLKHLPNKMGTLILSHKCCGQWKELKIKIKNKQFVMFWCSVHTRQQIFCSTVYIMSRKWSVAKHALLIVTQFKSLNVACSFFCVGIHINTFQWMHSHAQLNGDIKEKPSLLSYNNAVYIQLMFMLFPVLDWCITSTCV